MPRSAYLLVAVLAAGMVLATSQVNARCGCHGTAMVTQPTEPAAPAPAPATAAAPRNTNRQYSYQPGTVVRSAPVAPTARTYSARRGYRSYSYQPGNAYVGPTRQVRGAATKANADYAPYRGNFAPPQ